MDERIIIGRFPETSLKVLEIAREHGRVTVSDAVRTTGINRNTIKDHIKSLTANNHLKRHGAGRGSYYSLIGITEENEDE